MAEASRRADVAIEGNKLPAEDADDEQAVTDCAGVANIRRTA